MRRLAGAYCGATPDVPVQTRATSGANIGCSTFSERIEAVDQLEVRLKTPNTGKGPKVQASILYDPPRPKDARILLVGDTDHWVRLPIFEIDIVARAVVFYQVVFENERLVLITGQ